MFSDWLVYFWKQIENIQHVQPGIFNIPWLFVGFQPFRLIGNYPTLVLVEITSLYIVFRIGREFKLSKLRMTMIFLSAPVFWNFFMGQVDGLIMAAYLLPPTFAVLLTLFKPQTSLWAGWDGIRKRHSLVLMVLILLLFAFLIWKWPFSITDVLGTTKIDNPLIPPIINQRWNWSLWPWGILFIPFILQSNKKTTGMFLSPFIFPYIGLQSLIGPLIALAEAAPLWLFILTWLLLWVRWAWMLKLF